MSNKEDITFYRYTAVLSKKKEYCIRKIGKPLRFAFCTDYGVIPVGRINATTRQVEDVVNTRGNAYAARCRQMYCKNRKKEK